MARPFTPRIARLVACPEMWHHYVFDRAINTTGLSPAGSQNCRLLHLGGTLSPGLSSLPGAPPGPRDERPGTFDFLGFTHYWGRTLKGNWAVNARRPGAGFAGPWGQWRNGDVNTATYRSGSNGRP